VSPWRYLWRLYQPRSGWLLLAFISLATTWLSAVALLATSGWFITACALAGAGLIINLNFFTPSAIIRVLAILRTVGRYAERVIGHEAILRVLSDLRVRAFSTLANRPAQQIDEQRYTDLVSRLTADVDTLDAVPLRLIGPAFAAIVTWLTVVVIALNWGGIPIAMVLATGGALTFISAICCAKYGRVRGIAVVQARAAQRIAIGDHLGGLAELLSFRQANASAEHLTALDREQTVRLLDQEKLTSFSEHLVQVLTAFMALTVLALSWPIHDAPTTVLLTLMTIGLNEALGSLPGVFWRVGESEQAARRLMDLQASEVVPTKDPDPDPDPSSTDNDPTEHPRALLIESLLCQRQPYPSRALSIALRKGAPLVVFGKSGSGKTSLVSTLAGELKPLAGSLDLAGVNLLDLPDTQRYQLVGFLSQNDQLLDLTIREFLCLGLHAVDQQRLYDVMHAVDLLSTLEQTPEGFDYRMGVGGSRISGGQARRLQLASLLLRDPKLILLDEPFRGLQPALVQTIIERITPWLSQRFCVIVTHDPQALPSTWPRLSWPSA
jgi:ATP-binding cassette subfamily C protein CydC